VTVPAAAVVNATPSASDRGPGRAEWTFAPAGCRRGPSSVPLHALEESEHKAVAFDVYRHAGGTERVRRGVMKAITVGFLVGVGLAVVLSLALDRGSWWPHRDPPQRACSANLALVDPRHGGTDPLLQPPRLPPRRLRQRGAHRPLTGFRVIAVDSAGHGRPRSGRQGGPGTPTSSCTARPWRSWASAGRCWSATPWAGASWPISRRATLSWRSRSLTGFSTGRRSQGRARLPGAGRWWAAPVAPRGRADTSRRSSEVARRPSGRAAFRHRSIGGCLRARGVGAPSIGRGRARTNFAGHRAGGLGPSAGCDTLQQVGLIVAA
jgi:hypothetical protein